MCVLLSCFVWGTRRVEALEGGGRREVGLLLLLLGRGERDALGGLRRGGLVERSGGCGWRRGGGMLLVCGGLRRGGLLVRVVGGRGGGGIRFEGAGSMNDGAGAGSGAVIVGGAGMSPLIVGPSSSFSFSS